jgi:hypothetical protein
VRYETDNGPRTYRTARKPRVTNWKIGDAEGEVMQLTDEDGNVHVVSTAFVIKVTKQQQNLKYGTYHEVK